MTLTSFRVLKGEIDHSSVELLRTEKMDGRDYLVAPVVALVEGVHNGEFVAFEEIAVFPESWDGRPLPIDHPSDSNGIAITANSPKVIESSVVGFLFNVVKREDLRGISGEIWVDIEKAGQVPGGDEVLRKLNEGEHLEVSTAYYTFVENVPGEWKNPNGTIEKFVQTQTSLRPDHLALLPFDLGACSWQDGCGTPRVNATEKSTVSDHTIESSKDITTGDSMPKSKEQKELTVNGKQLGRVLQGVLAAHNGEDGTPKAMMDRLAIACGIDVAKVQALVAGELDFAPRSWLTIFSAVLDIDGWDLMMAASNDNTDARHRENDSTVKDSVTISDNKKSEVVQETENSGGEPCSPCKKTLKAQVQELVNNTLTSLGISLTKNEEKEQEKDTTMDKKARVEALIASDKNKFSANHREWLMSLSDEQIDVLEPTAVIEPEKTEEPAPAAEPATKAEKVVEKIVEVQKPITKDDVLAALGITEEALAAVRANVDDRKAARTTKIAQLAAIDNCPYSKEELETMSDSMLDKTADSLQPLPFRTSARVNGSSEDNSVPKPPSILLATDSKEGK